MKLPPGARLVCNVRYHPPPAIMIAALASLLPVQIAPAVGALMTAPSVTLDGTQAQSAFGVDVCPAGDINGDGYPDLIVGAYLADNGETDEGAVYVYLGSSQGFQTQPAWTAEINEAGAAMGTRLTSGDYNGDGYGDVAAAAIYADNGSAGYAGRVFVWFGGPPGPGNPSGLGANGTPANADWQRIGTGDFEYLGFDLTTGNFDGDAYDDLVVGGLWSSTQTPFPLQEGRVYVFQGSAAGPATTPSWFAQGDQNFGYLYTAAAADVNNDGFDDLLVGQPGWDNSGGTQDVRTGRAFLYLGSATGLGANGTTSNADWMATTDEVNSDFGAQVASVGDVNGDGYEDIMIGSPNYDNGETDEGKLFVWYGGPSGGGNNRSGLGPNGTPSIADWSVEGGEVNKLLGGGVIDKAGDLNGDGYDDVFVADQLQTVNGNDDAGRVLVWFGGATGLGPSGSLSTADLQILGDQAEAYMGSRTSRAGDINGDGFDDLAVGVYAEDTSGGLHSGQVRIYFGTCGLTDGDGDGVAPAGAPGCGPGNLTDCNDADGGAWDTPGEARSLRIDPDKTTVEWDAPGSGSSASGTTYDALRSTSSQDFAGAPASCLESNDGPNRVAVDASTPPSGTGYFYLVRAEDSCPGAAGHGSLGKNSSGAERIGRNCP